MNINELKRALYEYKQIDRKLSRQDMLIKEYREEINTIRFTAHSQVSDMPHGTDITDPVYNAAIKALEGKYREYLILCKKEIIRLRGLKCTLDYAFSRLEGKEQEIFDLRYQQEKSWRQIEFITHYSERNMFYIHDNAIERILKICSKIK